MLHQYQLYVKVCSIVLYFIILIVAPWICTHLLYFYLFMEIYHEITYFHIGISPFLILCSPYLNPKLKMGKFGTSTINLLFFFSLIVVLVVSK